VSRESSHQKLKGQYFTPPEIADLAWELTLRLAGRKPGRPVAVVDPAAGEGIFLQAAQRYLDPGADLLAADIDPLLEDTWRDLRKNGLSLRTVVTNGLCNVPESGLRPGAFHFVVGNPPFGGEGLRADLENLSGSGAQSIVEEVVLGLESWRPAGLTRELLDRDWTRMKTAGAPPGRHLERAVRKLRRYKIEALFLERFIRLARPSGWIAVILPDGLLANDRHLAVREWALQHAELRAVVALPRRTFAHMRTAANTSLVVLRKLPARSSRQKAKTLFASPEYTEPMRPAESYFEEVRSAIGTRRRTTACCRWVPSDEVGARRWHTGYVHPSLAIPGPGNIRYPLISLGEFIEFITYGPIITGRRVQDEPGGEVRVIGQGAIQETGVDLRQARPVRAGSAFDLPRSRPQAGDLLLPRSGMGTLAKNKVAVFLGEVPANVGCFVDIVRLRGLNPFYVWLFLKTDYGSDQIRRLINGVGTPNLSFEEVRSLQVPVAPSRIQREAESRYRQEVLPLHEISCSTQAAQEGTDTQAEAESRFRRTVEWLREKLVSQP